MMLLFALCLFHCKHVEKFSGQIQPNGSYYHHFTKPFASPSVTCKLSGGTLVFASRQVVHVKGEPGTTVSGTCQ